MRQRALARVERVAVRLPVGRPDERDEVEWRFRVIEQEAGADARVDIEVVVARPGVAGDEVQVAREDDADDLVRLLGAEPPRHLADDAGAGAAGDRADHDHAAGAVLLRQLRERPLDLARPSRELRVVDDRRQLRHGVEPAGDRGPRLDLAEAQREQR